MQGLSILILGQRILLSLQLSGGMKLQGGFILQRETLMSFGSI